MKGALSDLAAALLGAWFVAIFLMQVPATRGAIMRYVKHDRVGLLPGWMFFSGTVGDTDVQVLFRDRNQEGRVGMWREAFPIGRKRLTDVWGPERRIEKAHIDLVRRLMPWELRAEGVRPLPKRTVLSWHYLMILNYVSQLSGEPAATERQFAIVRTGGLQPPRRPDILLVSPFHQLQSGA